MRTRFLFAAIVVAALAACSSEGDVPGLEGPDDIDDGALVDGADAAKADSLNTTATYYRAVRDMRKCAAPVCGGWYVSRVNREWTHCDDGKWRNACYVADMDHGRLGLSDDEVAALEGSMEAGQVLLRGGLVTRTYGTARLGQFRSTEAWHAASAGAPTGDFYKVTDRGLVCIYAPCPSLHEAKLNSTINQDIHALDLSRLGSEGLINQAWVAMESGPILVAGTHSRFVAPLSGKPGTSLDASQVYTRVRHAELVSYAPAAREIAGQAFADPTAATYPRTYRFDYATWNVYVEDAVSPCAPGNVCIWSGIVSRPATWTLAGDKIQLAYTAAAGTGYSLSYYNQLRVKKDSTGHIVLVEVQDDGLTTTDRLFRAAATPAE